MKLCSKLMVLAIISLFIGASIVPSISSESWETKTTYEKTQKASLINVRTIIVDDEGDGNITTIQGAIDIADEGDVIKVYSGTYIENVIIDKQLTIIGIDEELGIGDDMGKPIIDGSEIEDVVIIEEHANGVNISDFKIINSGITKYDFDFDSAIDISSVDNTINNNIIIQSTYGIVLKQSSNNFISNNTISSKYGGITLWDCSPHNTIINNSFTNDGLMFFDEDLYCYNHTIKGNTVNGKRILYYSNENSANVTKVPMDAGQIILVNCSNFLIANLTLTNTLGPIHIAFSSNNTVKNNNISDNEQDGMHIINSTNNIITENQISTNNPAGIFITNSNDNIIYNNNITFNGNRSLQVPSYYGGIVIRYNSENNLIYGNFFAGNNWFQVYNGIDCINKFDNGTYGNFWSNHFLKVDLNNDGISDVPYTIPVTGMDWYPLMKPHFESPEPIPPVIEEIEIPKEGYLHIGDDAIKKTSNGNTILFALPWMEPLTIRARVSSP